MTDLRAWHAYLLGQPLPKMPLQEGALRAYHRLMKEAAAHDAAQQHDLAKTKRGWAKDALGTATDDGSDA